MERSHKIKSWFSNNGGFNRRTQRFAGNLPASADRESREAILTLKVVRGVNCQKATLDEFQRLMRASLGDQVQIRIEFVHHIPVSPSGKRRYFARHF